MERIFAVFSSNGHGRKTHIAITGRVFCNATMRWPWLLWRQDYFGSYQMGLIEDGIDPDGYLCKVCLRMAKAHLTSGCTNDPPMAPMSASEETK